MQKQQKRSSILASTGTTAPKYFQILEVLKRAIAAGEYRDGERLPSEAQLVRRFGVSRPTVLRALVDLQHQGLLERRAGSGTYVRPRPSEKTFVFGLLIPELGRTEIFEPICQGLAQAQSVTRYELLWGNTEQGDLKEKQIEQLCEHYISRKVSGVFFAPLESTAGKDETNERICRSLDEAHIPVVLLDRDLYAHPKRSHYDLVGIDNNRAGYVITEHLLKLGCRRIACLACPHSAPTVDERIAGYRAALFSYGLPINPAFLVRGDPTDRDRIVRVIEQISPEAFVCANDMTAAQLMRTLSESGVKVPEEIRITGIDDVKYAGLLSVPLTTIHQPCHHIGRAAVLAMFDRIANPALAARDILLNFELVVRQSCGATV